ncbi:hypothetical protein Pyn_20800 [Prunus yedoensis var. nudiflora]|uniref:Uncharacterized protein n=1 Tax=Prunus yedoensis var. nudiflora TaxID=2094558 RepID=A0A314ZAE6_PRUYE|nr:hypothetical protein Pyn_20800 [Prunus yedoensis var. nudiflora]
MALWRNRKRFRRSGRRRSRELVTGDVEGATGCGVLKREGEALGPVGVEDGDGFVRWEWGGCCCVWSREDEGRWLGIRAGEAEMRVGLGFFSSKGICKRGEGRADGGWAMEKKYPLSGWEDWGG